MSTMNQIVDATLSEVYGYTSTVDATTYLTAPIDTNDLSLIVGDASRFSRGIIQVDDELILASLVNRTGNTITLDGVASRGIRGSVAASHAAGAVVTMAPSIPRIQAVTAVNQTIQSSTGLFAVGSTSFTFNASVSGYSIPTEADNILSVSWMPTGPSNDYIRVRRWDYDRYNHQVSIIDPILPGRTVNVVYTKSPTLPALTADFSTSGLPASCEDVIRFGAAWRISSFLETRTLMAQTAEADAMDRPDYASGARIKVAQYLYGMYQTRLKEEVANLQSLYPIRMNYGG